jgi:hypothetical protein
VAQVVEQRAQGPEFNCQCKERKVTAVTSQGLPCSRGAPPIPFHVESSTGGLCKLQSELSASPGFLAHEAFISG